MIFFFFFAGGAGWALNLPFYSWDLILRVPNGTQIQDNCETMTLTFVCNGPIL